MNTLTHITDTFRQYEKTGRAAIAQIPEARLNWQPDPETNSIAVIVRHLYGNMQSRFTDFLTTDGEKPNRNRDAEFEEQNLSFSQLMQLWDKGWKTLFDTLESLKEEDLEKTITIRSEKHIVLQALLRQIAHYSYHLGQIVFLAKMICGNNWKSLSIPKGESDKFNKLMSEQHSPK